jgi:hypothetical protein
MIGRKDVLEQEMMKNASIISIVTNLKVFKHYLVMKRMRRKVNYVKEIQLLVALQFQS